MTLKSSIALFGSLLVIIILISTQFALGQDDSSTESDKFAVAGEDGAVGDRDEETCPCIMRSECPRVYGENPLDFSELGHVEPCKNEEYVRCCGVSVSVVQQTDESPPAVDEHHEDTTWDSDSGHEQQDHHSEEQNSSHEENDKDDFHESEGHDEHSELDEEKQPEAKEDAGEKADEDGHDEMEKASDEEHIEDHLQTEESRQEPQTVMVEPEGLSPRRPFLRKFQRFRRPTGGAIDSQEHTSPGSSSSSGETGSDEGLNEGGDKLPSHGDNGGSVVYSQRVIQFPSLRSRNNKKPAPNADSGSNDLDKFNKVPTTGENGESSPANGDHRPKFPTRRRRPNNHMRNRVQTTEQEEDVGNDNRNPVDTEEGIDQNGVNGALSSSSAQNSPDTVHVSIQTIGEATQDELGNQRRPMSGLVRPRVNALHGIRKKPGVLQRGKQQSESLHSDNSNGPAPTSDNDVDGEKLPHDPKREESLVQENDHHSKATIGSADVTTGPLTASEKLLQNSPTGKLAPLRPKIRSFSRGKPNHMLNADGSTEPESSYSPNNDINQGEGLPDGEPGEDAKLVPATPTRPTGVNIRKVPIRRVKPVVVEIGNDSQNGINVEKASPLPTSPVKGRPIMRRPINSASLLKNNKQALLADHETQLEGIQGTEEPQQIAEVKIEKLDVRERFRGRHRNNPVKAPVLAVDVVENKVRENIDNPSEHLSSSSAQSSSSESKRPNMLRKRRPLLRPLGQGPTKHSDGENDGKPAENNDLDNVKASTSPANPESSLSEEENADKPSGEIPRVKVRVGMNRLSSLRRGQQQQEAVETSTPIPPPEEKANDDSSVLSNVLRQRQRLTSHRGNLRRPQSTAVISATGDGEGESGLSDLPATSETPVTVTSSYSRLRVNSKNGFPPRPVFRRPSITKQNEEAATTSSPVESSSAIKENEAIHNTPIGTRSRFRVQSRFPVTKSETEPSQKEASDKELEKQGQLSQLNETPEDNSSHVQEKKVGFGQRKRVRVRVRPQHNNAEQDEKPQNNNGEEQQQPPQQQQEEQQLLPNPEEKHGAYNQLGSNPENPNSEHVVTEDTVAYQTPSISPPLNQEPEEQNPSSGSHSTDEVKIVLAGELSSETEHTGSGKDHVQKHRHQDEDDDSKSHFDDEQMQREKYNIHPQHPTATAEVDIDAYDLILNQDVRKTLGTQSTHSTHNEGFPGAYQVGGENGQGYDDSSAIQHAPPPSYHLTGDNNQTPAENHYDHFSIDEHRKNMESEDEHKYSTGIHPQEPTRLTHSNPHGIQRETDDMGNIETLELGTPDYDDDDDDVRPGNSYNDWHSYDDDLDEDEEESRVQEKVVRNNKSRFNNNSLSLSTKEHVGVQKGNRFSNEDRQVNTKVGEVGLSTPHNSLNPSSSQREPSTVTHSRLNDDAIKARERIRQKLRRPPSAYINNNSAGSVSTSHKNSEHTSAPFIPSIASPRPTYSGHEALLESVNQSVASLPKSETIPNYPDAKPLEQFIKNKQLAPRNRTRVRVKLVTLPTTTPTPSSYVSSNDHYEENGNENNVAADASLVEDTRRRPSSSGFSFPPFKKSNLAVISTTEVPLDEEPAPVSYSPEPVIFSPSPITTTTTPTTRRPFKTIKENYNKVSVSPGQSSSSSGGAHVAVQSLATHKNKYGTRQRFKVSELNSEASPSSPTAKPSSPSSPSYKHVEPVQKPHIRLRAPEYKRKIPTTLAPIRHPHPSSSLPSTSPPIYSNKENQSPTYEEDAITSSTPHKASHNLPTNDQYDSRPVSAPAYQEVEPENISIRITSHPTSVIDHDTIILEKEAEEELQYVPAIRQPENVIQNAEHNYIPHLPHAPVNKHIGKESSTYSSNAGAASPPKGKQSSRFKVPEKFNHQKTSSASDTLSNNNRIKPISHQTSLVREEERPIRVIEAENDVVKYFDEDDVVSVKVNHEHLSSPPQHNYQHPAPNPPQQTFQQHIQNLQDQEYERIPTPHRETYQPHPSPPKEAYQPHPNPPQHTYQHQQAPLQNAYQPQTHEERPVHVYQNPANLNIDLPHKEAPNYSNIPSHFEKVKDEDEEFVPDIRINVLPPTPTHYDGEHANRNEIHHAVRDRPTAHSPQRDPSFSNVLRQGPFGPFPSTDHWSGIPSENSPKPPEFFEQNERPSQIYPSHPPTHNQPEEIKSEYGTDWRILPKEEPRPHVPTMRFPDDKNVHFEEDKNNLSHPPPAQTTLIQFGTDFDGEEEEEEEKQVEYQHQRPMNHQNNLNLHGNQLHKQPVELSTLNGNHENRIPLGAPHHPHHPPPANFQSRPIQTVVVPPKSSVIVPLPLPGHPIPPSNNVHLVRPHLPHHTIQHQSNSPNFPPNEPPRFINKPGPYQQEHSSGGIPHGKPNPIPQTPHEIKDGEIPNVQFRFPHGDGAIKDLPLRQPHPQFTQNHQPNGNNLRSNERPHQLHHQQNPTQHHHQNTPAHPHQPSTGETFQKPGEQRETLLRQAPHSYSQNAPAPSNTPTHVGQRHPGAPTRAVGNQPSNNYEKPLERPHGNILFEKEPESRPINGPQLANNFPTNHLTNTRDPLQRPLQPPKSQLKLPESISQELDPISPPPKPGQYGPPPPSQLKSPPYVPFNLGQNRPLRNESFKQVHNVQSRPPHPMHHQGLPQQQQHIPGKFNGGQAFPPFSHPPRQNPNGNIVSPQQFAPHNRPQQPHMMTPGFPKGPIPNNPFFQQQHPQRFRNPNARTSRAANLTAEEEKAKQDELAFLLFLKNSETSGEDQTPELSSFDIDNTGTSTRGGKGMKTGNEDEEKAKQDELAILKNSETSVEQQEQLSTTDDVDKAKTDTATVTVSQPEDILDEHLIPTSIGDLTAFFPEALPDSSFQRKERELNLDEVLSERLDQADGNKDQRDTLSGEENTQDPEDDMIAEESIAENFLQDHLPEETPESSESQTISHPYHPTVDSTPEITQGAEQTEDILKSSKQKNFRGHKGKPEKRFILKSSDFPSEDKLALSEHKKGGLMKIKGAKAKSEQQEQQHLAKFKEALKPEKKQQNNNEIPEQQEFVAPTLVQRGFHPILPYSEKDPGPILVQLPPKVEKLLPPSIDLKEGGGRMESGATLQVLGSSSGNPSMFGVFGLSSAFKSVQDPTIFLGQASNQIPVGV